MSDLLARAGFRDGELQPISDAPTSEILRLRALLSANPDRTNEFLKAFRQRERLRRITLNGN